MGSLQGVSADSRAQEKVPGLGLTGVVHASALQAEDASGRFSRQWISDFLYGSHDHLVGQGFSMAVSRLQPHQADALGEWEGKFTDGSSILSETLRQRVREDGQREILPHADAYLKQGPEPELKSNEFQTPPRPVASSEKTEALPPLPSFPVAEQEEDQEDVMSAAVATLKNLGPERRAKKPFIPLARLLRSTLNTWRSDMEPPLIQVFHPVWGHIIFQACLRCGILGISPR